MPALISCPAVLAVELVPEGAPGSLALPLESAHLFGEKIAEDLVRLLPGVESLGLSVSAALYDVAQILRPGWPIHAELALMHQQAQRGTWMPAITSFGLAAGQMVTPLLMPDPRLIGSPLLLVPFVLVGPAEPAGRVMAAMEQDFETLGLAASATSLFLNEAFSIRSEHVRYLSLNDLCAMMAMQYEHAGFTALWSVIECALLSPQRNESVVLDSGVQLDYRDGRVSLRGNDTTAAFRQAAAILAAHGLHANAN